MRPLAPNPDHRRKDHQQQDDGHPSSQGTLFSNADNQSGGGHAPTARKRARPVVRGDKKFPPLQPVWAGLAGMGAASGAGEVFTADFCVTSIFMLAL